MARSKLAPTVTVVSFLLAATGAAAHGAAWKVTSTLDGKKVLGRRVAWIAATPGLPRAELKSGGISFLIDGKIVSFTDEQPYTFPDHGGYLVTTWLKPGPHTFTVRARAKDGTIMDDNVTASVVAASPVAATLVGTWTRTLTDTSGAPKPGPNVTPTPTGTYKLVFDSRWVQTRFPGKYLGKASFKTGNGFVIDNDWTPSPQSFQALGGVQFKVLLDSDAEGGWWCEAGGPAATYNWNVSGNTLTLTPVGGTDSCASRGVVWAGQWTRVG
jgi:hypothetical protein